MSFHKSNLGKFGTRLPCDMDGYVHTTAADWKKAALNGKIDMSSEDCEDEDYLDEWAEAQAKKAREAVRASEEGLSDWRKNENKIMKAEQIVAKLLGEDCEGKECPAKKIAHTLTRDSSGDWVLRVRVNGKVTDTYYTDDKTDATDTLKVITDRINKEA